MEKIKIGILGYGNLGKGVEKAVCKQPDMELTGIYSRRTLVHPLYKSVDVLSEGEDLDLLILCGGSATDLPVQTPQFARLYNVIDSFDHHQQIPQHYAAVDQAAREGGRLALISCGWDPGLFSMMRAMLTALLPDADVFTFWGRGISQGHSDAIRRIKGVKDARQYTVPLEHAIEAVKSGLAEAEDMKPEKMHRRECFVVAEEGADKNRITYEIENMPDYFTGYETTVHYISQEKMDAEHRGFPHGGTVIGTGKEAAGSFQLDLSSNPKFTAGVLVAYARAVCKMGQKGETGCRTMLEIPVSLLCEEMFMHM
ncbi:MAG: diaminopimelate dehydrogenase [Firmicutes bacterium]|nr:diaminopimelate dehydrogenase [Bacillota bacterium]